MSSECYLAGSSETTAKEETGASTSAGGEGKEAGDTQHYDMSGSQDLFESVAKCTESVCVGGGGGGGVQCHVWSVVRMQYGVMWYL